ncbi:hypothetical protein D0809_13790 [Flavobacterium circumlabens]|uniref:Zincin-like metallopeptidase toxin 3 of polymorphic toxin system n=2 Tax=Flavobacterium circumlabens TaxID=2133765 RepID=A0A4Y7UC14_9FLAO|nr:zincin-like metallopeptidase toxin 3 of polymorphic toxin system [Flavobacterium circumlabens]TEB43956.1 hypothetical protein D0809_13790 [Flavobacterium circumlabens]
MTLHSGFTVLDPITHYSQSPYSAFNNNPIYWADPSGMAGEHYNFQAGRYENDKGSQVTFGEAMASQGLNENGSEKTGDSNSSSSSATSTTSADINPKEAFEYQKKYPRTMQVLRQIRGYAKSNPDILKALSEFSGYSTMEILDKLQYSNSSVLMEIRELQSLNKYNPEGLNNGSAAFYLSIENAEFLETLKTNAEIQAYSFFVAVTILHEFVHVGRINNKMPEPREMGWGWEERAYGKKVNGDSYKEVYKSSNWNFKDNNYKYKLAPLF